MIFYFPITVSRGVCSFLLFLLNKNKLKTDKYAIYSEEG